jgi:lysyl-tRNA synthetase class II
MIVTLQRPVTRSTVKLRKIMITSSIQIADGKLEEYGTFQTYSSLLAATRNAAATTAAVEIATFWLHSETQGDAELPFMPHPIP